MILCKADRKFIQRLANKRNIVNDVQFEAFLSPSMSCVVFAISIKTCFERGDFLLCNDLDLH